MSLALQRSRRQNAGAKMAKLIENEEEDEFYKTAYGGFNEIEEDNEFEIKEEEIEEDYVDSDFDIDENEQPEVGTDAAADDEETKRKRPKRGVVTKAYKEPKIVNSSIKKEPIKKEATEKEFLIDKNHYSPSNQTENKKLRVSTAQKRKELEERQQEREARHKLKAKKAAESVVSNEHQEMRRLTQEELLSEAKITEEINLASLDAYQKLEIEKKKIKQNKNLFNGPIIRYHSVTMPKLEEEEEDEENEENLELDNDSIVKDQFSKKSSTGAVQSRNFIVFTNEETIEEIFSSKEQQKPKPKKCVITGLPAKYIDPLTKCPYANLFAFKKIRELYASKKSLHHNINDQ